MNIIEFNGETVVETKDAAEIFCKKPGDLLAVFLQNQATFKEGEHYYLIDDQFEDFGKFKNERLDQTCTDEKEIYLWTEEGLYQHAALMQGIHAWHAYCQLIYFFFKDSEEVKQAIRVLQKAHDIMTRERVLYFMAKELFCNETSFK